MIDATPYVTVSAVIPLAGVHNGPISAFTVPIPAFTAPISAFMNGRSSCSQSPDLSVHDGPRSAPR